MIAFERIKELVKNKRISLREVNDKAKLVNCFLHFFCNNLCKCFRKVLTILLLFIVGKQKARKINTYGGEAVVWVRFFTHFNISYPFCLGSFRGVYF